jgi:hypothetical protein
MAAQVTGSKTVTHDVSPSTSATLLTSILATPIENLTIAQLETLTQALRKVPGGHAPGVTVGSLLR